MEGFLIPLMVVQGVSKASTVLIGNRDAPPISSEDILHHIRGVSDIIGSSDGQILFASACQVFGGHASRVFHRYPRMVRYFAFLATSFCASFGNEEAHPVLLSSILEDVVTFVKNLVSTISFPMITTFDTVIQVSSWMLRDSVFGDLIAKLVARCVLLCAEDSSLYPNRIAIRGPYAVREPLIVRGVILDHEVGLRMRSLSVKFPLRVLLLSCSVDEDALPTLMRLVIESDVGVIASQRLVSDSVHFLLGESGVAVIDRLSIASMHHFALTTGSSVFNTLESASGVQDSDLGVISTLTCVGQGEVLIEGPSRGQIYTLCLPMGICPQRVESCFQSCARMFSDAKCVPGDGGFENHLLCLLENAEASPLWAHVCEVLRLSVESAIRLDLSLGEVPIHTPYAFSGSELESPWRGLSTESMDERLFAFTEALEYASTMLRIQRVSSL